MVRVSLDVNVLIVSMWISVLTIGNSEEKQENNASRRSPGRSAPAEPGDALQL